MRILTILTTIAGIIMSLGYFPQAIKILKNRTRKNISIATYVMFFVGISLWFIYGIYLKNPPLIISNSVAFLGCSFVLFAICLSKK